METEITFMPLGALTGGLGGALLFGVIAIRDAGTMGESSAFVQRKKYSCIFSKCYYVMAQIVNAASRHGVADDAHQGRLLNNQSSFGNQTS